MALSAELSSLKATIDGKLPPWVSESLSGAISGLQDSFSPKSAIQAGDTLPSFQLPDAVGKTVDSADLINRGPMLIVFYRGSWCPFCNLALHDLQRHFDAFQKKGVAVVAISPELPDHSLSYVEKQNLQFIVLSDNGNHFARKLGIVWKQPESLRPVYKQFNNDLETRNGDDSFELPIPTTLLVDGQGKVKNIYIEPDYTKRLDTSVALEWIDQL